MRYLIYVYYIVLFLASFFAVKNFKLLNSTLKFFALLVIVTFVVELTAYNLAISKGNNIYIYVLFMPIQLILINLAYFCYHVGVFFRKIVVSLTFVFFAIFLIFFKGINFTEFPIKLIMIENLIVLFIVIYSSFLIINKEQYAEIKRNNLIWINMGFVFFVSTTFFMWGFHFLIKTSQINLISRFTLATANIILYSTMAYSFFRANSKSEFV